MSDYNVFIGKNGTGKSNLSTILYRFTIADPYQVPKFIKFRGSNDVDQKIEEEIEIEKFEIESLKNDPEFISFMNLYDQTNGNNPLKIVRNMQRELNRASIKGIDTTEKNFRTKINPLFYDSLFGRLKKRVIFLPETRDLRDNFTFYEDYSNLPITVENLPTFLTYMKLNNRDSYEELIKDYKKIVPLIKDLIIDPVKHEILLLEEVDDFSIIPQWVSKGTRELIILLATITLSLEGSIIFIEEPEIHLHPGAIKKLRDFIREKVKEKSLQVFITTHNYMFLDGLYPETDKTVKVYEFIKSNDGETLVSKKETDAEISEAEDSLLKP